MTTIRSCLTASSSDLLAQNQTSNVVYPVRPQSLIIEANVLVGWQVSLPTLCYSLKLEIEV